MRILVHEFASGGGLAGRPVPRSLAREGSAMLAALVTDLTAIPGLADPYDVGPAFPAAGAGLSRSRDTAGLVAPSFSTTSTR